MTDLHKAAQQALEALYCGEAPPNARQQAAADALRAALAQQAEPLTDEQISDLWCEVSNTDFVTADTHVFARAVERAHGIGRQTDPQIADRLARHGIPKP